MIDFGRVVTAMVTPFRADGSLDTEGAVKLARYLADHGTDTILLAGTTGESPTLTSGEKVELIRAVKAGVPGVQVMAGTGSNNTQASIEASRAAEEAGADALRDFAAENNTVYWDFSLYKDVDTLNLLVGDFSDAHHLNGQGAEKFTAVLCDTIAQENAGEDVSTLFYDTVEEKLELTPDQSIAMAHL